MLGSVHKIVFLELKGPFLRVEAIHRARMSILRCNQGATRLRADSLSFHSEGLIDYQCVSIHAVIQSCLVLT
jgi:hypothetical protein